MLSAADLQAIAKIERRTPGVDPVLLGTGSVVGESLILTADHVVRGSNDVWLSFGRDRRIEGPGSVILRDAAADWALIDCPLAQGIKPLTLRPLPQDDDGGWQTFAYFLPSGAYLSGEVYGRPGAHIDLAARELDVSKRQSVAGASGSPVIAHGGIAGMIVTEHFDFIVKEVLHLEALPIETIVKAALAAAAPDQVMRGRVERLKLDTEWLPYQVAFTSRLRHVDRDVLQKLAAELAINTRGADMAPDVARALLRGGYERAVRWLGQIVVPDTEMLCYLAESLWIDDGAASALHGAMLPLAAALPAALNASYEQTAKYYLDRANAKLGLDKLVWSERSVTVVYSSSETDGQLVDAVRAELSRVYPRKPRRASEQHVTDGELKRWAEMYWPMVAIIQINQPVTPELVAELEDTRKRLGVYPLVLTGPTLGEVAADGFFAQQIVIVLPELPDGHEMKMLDALVPPPKENQPWRT